MTKKLEDLFNLSDANKTANLSKAINKEIVEKAAEVTTLQESLNQVAAITKDLPKIKELDLLGDTELDALAKKAEEAYDDLMDLGMNVEVRYAGRIFEVAGSMMKNAIDAKAAKIDKKLKAIDLQLKKYKIDKEIPEEGDGMINGQGYIITDRNELLKKLGQKE
jgi:hypothetical protein